MTKHFISTTAEPATCPRCDTAILVALDEGLDARADPAPLDQAAEVDALLTGRRTYTRTPGGQLVERTADRISGGSLRGTVHAEHRCTPNPTILF